MNKERLLKQLNRIVKKDNLFKNCVFIEVNENTPFCWLCKKNFINKQIILNDKFGGLPLCFMCFLELNKSYKLPKDFIKLIPKVNEYNLIEAL